MEAVRIGVIEIMILICLYTDLKYGRIPNNITIPGFLIGIALSIIAGDITNCLFGAAAASIVYLTMYKIGYMAAGDVKFMIAAAALLGEKINYIAIPLVILSGTAISVMMLIKKGILIKVLKLSWDDLRYRTLKLIFEGKLKLDKPCIEGSTYMPFMPSIALGINIALFITNFIWKGGHQL